MLHALANAVVVEEIDEDPTKYLVLGPDRSARFLELVVLDRPQGPAVIHAMPMRTQYLKYLNGNDIKIDSVRPPDCKPNKVPRSYTRLNST